MFGFLKIGDTVATTKGTVTITGNPIIGGEGAGYKATLNGKDVFYKQFKDHDKLHPSFNNVEAVREHIHRRTQWLVRAKLHQLSPAFNAPFAHSTDSQTPSYVCKWINNLIPWSEWRELAKPYGERLSVIGQLNQLLYTLHAKGIAHGDVNGNNVCISGNGEALQVILIDFGNCNNGDPNLAPLMSNDWEHISPWLHRGQGLADRHSDLYALGVMAYEALLIKTIDSGGMDEKDMRARRAAGTLAGDPLCGTPIGDEQGLTFAILPPALQTQIRGLLAPDPNRQPKITEFQKVFAYEIRYNLIVCNSCTKPYFWHVELKSCPCCQAATPPALHVQLPDSVKPLKGNMQIGRDDFPDQPSYISAKQLVIQPAHLGMARVYMTGRNSMKLTQTSGARYRITNTSGAVDVHPGDVLELEGSKVVFKI